MLLFFFSLFKAVKTLKFVCLKEKRRKKNNWQLPFVTILFLSLFPLLFFLFFFFIRKIKFSLFRRKKKILFTLKKKKQLKKRLISFWIRQNTFTYGLHTQKKRKNLPVVNNSFKNKSFILQIISRLCICICFWFKSFFLFLRHSDHNRICCKFFFPAILQCNNTESTDLRFETVTSFLLKDTPFTVCFIWSKFFYNPIFPYYISLLLSHCLINILEHWRCSMLNLLQLLIFHITLWFLLEVKNENKYEQINK